MDQTAIDWEETMLMFKVLQMFQIFDDVETVERYGRGHINRTYFAKGKDHYYILQMMDCSLFDNPKKTIDNTISVCDHLLKRDPDGDQYVDLYTADHQRFIELKNTIWHGFSIPKNLQLFKKIVDEKMTKAIGKVLGGFHRSLNDFPLEKLHTTLSNNHNFTQAFERMSHASSIDTHHRDMIAFNETKFISNRIHAMHLIDELMIAGKIPARVTHNNIRLNNILFNPNGFKYAAMIGFDAVAKGTVLYDLGDTVRHLLSTTREDEINLNFVGINLDYFKTFIEGYFEEIDGLLTSFEEEHIVDAIWIMSLEEAMRYNTDFLENDVTYPVEYPFQNHDRAKNQIQLVKFVEEHYDQMKKMVKEARKNV